MLAAWEDEQRVRASVSVQRVRASVSAGVGGCVWACVLNYFGGRVALSSREISPCFLAL